MSDQNTTSEATSAQSPNLEGIDADILATARMLVEEKKARELSRRKFRPKGGSANLDDDLKEALSEAGIGDARKTMSRVFARTFKDVTLSNTFVDAKGAKHRHLTVRKATGMDGLRDIDEIPNAGVGVSDIRANGMNPEGRYNMPITTSVADNDYAKRYMETMDPTAGGADWSAVPQQFIAHFAQYATFIGFPLIETFALHPVISNAIVIPAEDAIAPGYTLSFLDSEDLNENGIPDELEAMEMGGVRKALGRIESIKALKEAVVSLSGSGKANSQQDGVNASIEALARVLERLAAYSEWERYKGAGEEAAQAVNEGFVKPITDIFERIAEKKDEEAVNDAISRLSMCISDLAKREHQSLDEVRSENLKRDTILAVNRALRSIKRKDEQYDRAFALTQLAVAVERLAAYQDYAEPNKECYAALAMALTQLSLQDTPETRKTTEDALNKTAFAMDADEFAFQDPNAGLMPDMGGEAQQAPLNAQPQPQAQGGATEPSQPSPEDEQKKQQEEREKAAKIANERQKMLDRWKQRADDMGMNKVCEDIVRIARMYGIAIAVPIIKGVDYEKEFDISMVKQGAYKGFTVIEPTFIYPETDTNDLVNPMSGSFMEPNYWAVTGGNHIGNLAVRRIHRSWLVIYRHKEVPIMFRPMYYFGGMSLTQELYEDVFIADKLMNEVPKLAMTKRTTVVKGDPNDLVVNTEGVISRLQAISDVQDNFGLLFVGRNADVTRLDTSLSEFDQCIAKANQRIASKAKMPETKLFKTQLAGMNSAGRYEWDDYSQLLISIENNVLIPLLAFHYRLDSQSQLGKVIQLKIEFNAIDVPTKSEKEEGESRFIQTVNAALQAQWIAPGEARILARGRKGGVFSSISAEMPKELMQQQPQGGMPGMGGMPSIPGMGGEGGGGDMPPIPQMSPEAGSPLDAPNAPKSPNPPQAKE